MKRVLEYARRKLRGWLGIDKLVGDVHSANVGAREANRVANDTNWRVRQMFDVAVDYREGGRSWAVICIAGKADYVRFVELSERDIREVATFLRQYTMREHALVDTPHGMPKKMFLDI